MQGAARLSVSSALGLTSSQLASVASTYGYVAFWILTSAGVILYNKWILTVWGFAFPITLTMWHMAFCSAVAFILVRPTAAHHLGLAARGGRAGGALLVLG